MEQVVENYPSMPQNSFEECNDIVDDEVNHHQSSPVTDLKTTATFGQQQPSRLKKLVNNDSNEGEEEFARMRRLLEEFLDDGDEDDSDAFQVVSSTKQRLDRLEEIENDIITVTSKPPASRKALKKFHNTRLSGNIPSIVPSFVFFIFGLVGLYYVIYFKKISFQSKQSNGFHHRKEADKSHNQADSKQCRSKPMKLVMTNSNEMNASHTKDLPMKSSKKSTSPNDEANDQLREKSSTRNKISTSNGTGRQDLTLEDIAKEGSIVDDPPNLHEENETRTNMTERDSPSLAISTEQMPSSPSSLERNEVFELSVSSSSKAYSKLSSGATIDMSSTRLELEHVQTLKDANEFAESFRGAEQALRQCGVSPSLAPIFVFNQQLHKQQQEREEGRRLWDLNQKILDRQLSQQQHLETVEALKYDPNWSDKLERVRGKCWNCVSRLMLEVGLIHRLHEMLSPIRSMWMGDNILSPRQVIETIATAACDCRQSGGGTAVALKPGTWAMFSVNLFPSLIDIESLLMPSICYGYCVLLYGTILLLALALHQVLRVFSVPVFIHNFINLAGVVLFYLQSNIIVFDSWCFLLLCGSIASLFYIVQLQFLKVRNTIDNANERFSVVFRSGMDRMENSHLALCLLRYFIIAMYAACWWTDESTITFPLTMKWNEKS